MPKIYAKHSLIPCGFITAKKPVGRNGTDPTAECAPRAEKDGSAETGCSWRSPRAGTAAGPRWRAYRVTARSASVRMLCSGGSVLPPTVLVGACSELRGHRDLSDKAGRGSIRDRITPHHAARPPR